MVYQRKIQYIFMSEFVHFENERKRNREMQDKMEEKIMIAPSIMCISEWHDTKNIFRQLKENGIAMIHADVMDGNLFRI